MLTDYFGPVVFQFGLKEALEHDPPVLVPYRYHPILVELEDDEQDNYLELTAAIGRCMSGEEDEQLSSLAKLLLIKRSRLLAAARRKLPALREVIAPFVNTVHTLVYCGDSAVEFGDDTDDDAADPVMIRQIDAVSRILGNDLGMTLAQFTAATKSEERSSILADFDRGDLQALVAIRCLDEGVDVPSISRAFILASSTNPRQFVQRRGRILRRAAGKSSADIYDFVVRPPSYARHEDSSLTAGRKLIKRELRRIREFADLAMNGPQARAHLMPLLREWDLLHA